MTGPVSFLHDQRPVRVVFGRGRLAGLADEVDSIGAARVMVVATRYSSVAHELLGGRVVDVETGPRAHVPVEQTVPTVERARRLGVDAVVAVGGGSCTGLAKAVALETGTPILAVPTTYSGSEMTRVWGRTSGGRKHTGRDLRVAPRTVIYDPDLLDGMPRAAAAASALNAVAHAAEGVYAPDRTPLTDLAALEAIATVTGALTGDADSADLLRGAYLAGFVLDSTTMGLHHKLCHVIGGSLDLPHASTHSVVLPYALAYNLGDRRIADRLASSGVGDLPTVVQELGAANGVATSLRDLGMPESAVDDVVDAVLGAPPVNPRPVDADVVRALVRGAWSGEPVEAGV